MKKILTVIAASLALGTAHADEGMWMISNLSAHTDSIMQSMGLELTHDEIYNTESPCLNNAIVQFGGFCSGVVVSPDGLVFTNHHCGYGSIQEHSTTAHDYLRDGFFAKRLKDELPNEGLYVDFHIKTYEVTDLINAALKPEMDNSQRSEAIDSVGNSLTDAIDDESNGIHAIVVPYYKGSKYYLSVYLRYSDVRLVFAPPQCLGKHGGDTDNWMWPRQTCDFSVFRIYAGKDNKPAEYSKDNVPFHPVRYAHISTQGYQPGTFCMTLGYPGSTDRYLSSYGIVDVMNSTNDPRQQVRGVKQEVMKAAMNSSDALRIMYSSKYAQSSNYWKFSIGQNKALRELKVVEEKQALEREINEWVMQRPDERSQYIGILDSLKVLYERNAELNRVQTVWEESFWNGSDIIQFVIRQLIGVMREKPSNFAEDVAKAYKDIDVQTDQRIFAAMVDNYRKQVSPAYLPDFYKVVDSIYVGNPNTFADALYAKSVFANPELLAKTKDFSEVMNDPIVEVTFSLIQSIYALSVDNSNVQEYERLLGEALREMRAEKEFYPDANFTLRLSYGIIEGYTTNEGVRYDCYTPSQSIVDKFEKQGSNPDYELTEPVYRWLKKGNWGKRYIDPKSGDLQLCFLSNNDITGGNSGSGMFDGKGRLIGLAFDGNWEAMSGDIKFDNNLQRTIGVDIRYVLSVIETYGKGKRLIKELTLE